MEFLGTRIVKDPHALRPHTEADTRGTMQGFTRIFILGYFSKKVNNFLDKAQKTEIKG